MEYNVAIIIETLSLVLLGVVFAILEYTFPYRKDPWKKQLPLDIISAVVFIGSVVLHRKIFLPLLPEFHLLPTSWSQSLPMPLKLILLLALVDLTLYWVHRIMHSRLLMPLHIWHHSAAAINWFSGFRASFLHMFFYSLVQILWANFLFPMSAVESSIGLGLGVFFQYFQHANIRCPWRSLEWFLVTPRSHRLHHTRSSHMNSNYAHMFTFWDRIFGTFTSPEDVDARRMPMGLGGSLKRKRHGEIRALIGI